MSLLSPSVPGSVASPVIRTGHDAPEGSLPAQGDFSAGGGSTILLPTDGCFSLLAVGVDAGRRLGSQHRARPLRRPGDVSAPSNPGLRECPITPSRF